MKQQVYLQIFFNLFIQTITEKYRFYRISILKLMMISFSLLIVLIEQKLNKLPNIYSAGPDGIPTILLKKLSPKISLPLTILFQSSLNQEIIPTDWKQVTV